MLRGVQSGLNAGAPRPVSTIHLIRHGQASFGSADYDRLSSLGEQQVMHLRDHYARIRQPVDAIYSGTLQRQRSTAEILASLHGDGDGSGSSGSGTAAAAAADNSRVVKRFASQWSQLSSLMTAFPRQTRRRCSRRRQRQRRRP